MAARSMATGRITFGLVTIPVRIYPAIEGSAGISFHLLHRKDNARVKQQYICSEDGEVVPRSEMVKGYELEKDQFVVFTNEELKALDERSTQGIEIGEFVPADSVDPIYYERSYYLGPDKGAEKPYALLARAMEESGRVALAKHATRGKDYLVLLRAGDGRLRMHQLYHSDEVRDVSDVPAEQRKTTAAEVELALQLIERISSPRFEPEKYEDEVRKRIQEVIARKADGEAIAPRAAKRGDRGKVVDLMEALKASLGDKPAAKPARAKRTSGSRGAARKRSKRAS